jgi:chromosome segregation ATPase
MDEAMRSGNIAADDYKQLERQVSSLKARIAQTQKEAQELRTQEIEVSNQLTTEQGRWVEFNSRLDELERLLPPSQR